jgi:hypothetical protein
VPTADALEVHFQPGNCADGLSLPGGRDHAGVSYRTTLIISLLGALDPVQPQVFGDGLVVTGRLASFPLRSRPLPATLRPDTLKALPASVVACDTQLMTTTRKSHAA